MRATCCGMSDDAAPPAPIKRYPTKLSVRCPECEHQGVVEVFLDKGPPRLRCSMCGDASPIGGRGGTGQGGGDKAQAELDGNSPPA
jgi:ribosomal protein S27E